MLQTQNEQIPGYSQLHTFSTSREERRRHVLLTSPDRRELLDQNVDATALLADADSRKRLGELNAQDVINGIISMMGNTAVGFKT